MKFLSISSLFLFAVLSLCLTSCGGDDDASIEEFLAEHGLTAEASGSGLYYSIMDQGDGEPITDDQFLNFHFRAYNLDNEVTGSTYTNGFPVALAVSDLNDGLREGVKLISEGGTIRVYIPPSLSNGGISEGLIIYEIIVLGAYDSVVEYNDDLITDYATQNNLNVERTSDGLYYVIEEPGDGDNPASSSTVTVDYKGYFLNGTQFDSSYDRGEALTISLGGVIEGWTLGIPLFAPGGKGTLLIPSYLAYGAQGSGSIPGNYPIAFDIELISFQ